MTPERIDSVGNGRSGHTPVLPQAIFDLLKPPANGVVVDATVGLAGHALLLGDSLGPQGRLIGCDVDPDNLAIARQRLSVLPCTIDCIEDNFGRLDLALEALGITTVDIILADLGMSSAQLDNPDRGFSFQQDGPLDMRLDPRLDTTAAELIRSLREQELADLIFRYGEERFSRRIARAIVAERQQCPITGTEQLARIVCRGLGRHAQRSRNRIHPATRTFQALRIAVNDELGQLERLLGWAPKKLAEGGRIGIISFHSLEDRAVKQAFRAGKQDGYYQVITKKPLTADDEECRENPRSRSAKLRVAQRVA